MRSMNSFSSLLGQQVIEAPEDVVERVRAAMLGALTEHLGQDGQELKQRVHYERDIEGLWYLRPEIMNAIATQRGEAEARVCMTGLTVLFKGHHSSAAASRFGRL